MNPRKRLSTELCLAAATLTAALFITAFVVASPRQQHDWQQQVLGRRAPLNVPAPREQALQVAPLYDEPAIVSDDELRAVLRKLLPRFAKEKMRPNAIEHALRTWTVKATFNDPAVRSGEEMKNFLLDHGQYLASWGPAVDPLLTDEADGVAVRWGKVHDGSVHHDHLLASLTEAGVGLHEPVFTPGRRDHTLQDVLLQSLADFRVDEVEVEWSTLAAALWLAPHREWTTRDGRQISFDLLVDRIIRGHQRMGVCLGTHRVFSLMVLVRLDDAHRILSPAARGRATAHLASVRDMIIASQWDDGRWPSNWQEGAEAKTQPETGELYKQVIATGHHLEWLALAPRELHPPQEALRKAARWLVETTNAQTDGQILAQYTFYSHVANALSLWRNTRPWDYWSQHGAAMVDQP